MFNLPPQEVIRIGVGRACITSVTPQVVAYVDERGTAGSIDLEDGDRNATTPIRRVGYRDVLDKPPWVEFENVRRTRFEFTTYDEAYALLLDPLAEAGWYTTDMG